MVAGTGWEEGDTRLRESQPVSFREKDERSSSKGSWESAGEGLFGWEKDGRRRGRGEGGGNETKRERERLMSAGERGRKCGWDGNEGRWRCSEVYEG